MTTAFIWATTALTFAGFSIAFAVLTASSRISTAIRESKAQACANSDYYARDHRGHYIEDAA